MWVRPIILGAAAVMLAGCRKLTMDNYAKLKTGLEYSQVVAIIGKPDSCSEALFVKSCVWGDEQKNIKVNFVSDKVMLATCKNLK